MNIIPTKIKDLVIIEPDVFRDPRGYFLEVHQQKKFADAGIHATFVQDNRSCSVKNTLRGLHAQIRFPQGKLVSVIEGEIFDAVVDIRKNSPTFGQWESVVLSADNFRQFYVPPGMAHGFVVTSERAIVEYKCTEFYNPPDEFALLWNDKELGIPWPVSSPLLSKKDVAGLSWNEFKKILKS